MLRARFPSCLSVSAVITLAIGLLTTAILFLNLRAVESHRTTLDFELRARTCAAAVEQGFSNAIRALLATNQLFVSMGNVRREQFQSFAQYLLARNPDAQALVFHRLVRSSERTAFEAKIGQVIPGAVITERGSGGLVRAADREFYVVDDYVEPLKGNELTLGYDIWSHPPQRAAVQAAIDTGLPTASVGLPLLQVSNGQHGMTIVMPVYQAGVPLPDVAARRRAFIGDTEIVLNVGTLIGGALTAAKMLDTPGMSVNVYAPVSPGRDELMFRTNGPVTNGLVANFFDRRFGSWPRPYTHSFEVAGQTWRTVVVPTDIAVTNYIGSLLTLVFGVLLTLLATVFVQTSASRTSRIGRLVEERTAELKHALDTLRIHKRAIQSSANGIAIISARGPDYPVEYVNPAFEQILGYASHEVLGRSLSLIDAEEPDSQGFKTILAGLRERRSANAVLRNRRKDGTILLSDVYIAPVKNDDGETEHFVVTQYDVTATKAYEAELEFQANYDTLTGLANRNLLHDRINQALNFASGKSRPVWIVLFDIDHFKYVNDTLGHQSGDALLKVIADRLKSVIDKTDTIARLSGDEFVLVLPHHAADERQVSSTAQALMDIVAQPITLNGHEFFPTCSVGVAVYPVDGGDPESLIKHAEVAMYRAKERGRNNFQFYAPAMNAKALERLQMEGDLRAAVEQSDFLLHYQPQVDLRTGLIVGMEALIRWQHPQLGMVPPGRFIGLAEETGLIEPIGQWVLRTACAQNKAWQDAGLGNLRIAINLSARQFQQADLVDTIVAALAESGLEGRFLEVELTESLMMVDVELAIEKMRAIKALGVQISIDDFGTGYSSLSYLKRFPIDVLKIDQSFVRDITVNQDDAAVAVAVISLAHSLDLHVIAEGVETEAQLAYLKRHECDQMQGYFFSRPLSTEAFEQLLRDGKRLPENPRGAAIRV